MTPSGAVIGDLLSIEGRAIKQAYQGNGIGKLALHDLIDTHYVQAAASVTRNPAIPRLMQKAFHTVSPDLTQPDPLHVFKSDDRVRAFSEVYAEHVGADNSTLPFVLGRYEGGLYGYTDPGQGMGISEVAANEENGIIMVALDRRNHED